MLFAVVSLLAISGVVADRSLNLRLSGAYSFAGAESVSVTSTLTNNGDEKLVLLNAPFTVLSELPTKKFSLLHENGGAPKFVGAVARFIPEAAKSFTTLAPGASLCMNHSLTHAYDFTSSGPGLYVVKPASSMFFLLTEGGVEKIYAETNAHVVHLSDTPSRQVPQQAHFEDDIDFIPEEEEGALMRPRFIGCSNERQRDLIFSAQEAQLLGDRSFAYLNSRRSTTARYKEWFGAFTSARHSRVRSVFQKMSTFKFGAMTYDCNCNTDDYAYTYPNQPGKMWLCTSFWPEPTRGPTGKASTLVHEATHWEVIAGTDDHDYGQGDCRNLASRDPDMAIDNADNYAFFAANSPYLP